MKHAVRIVILCLVFLAAAIKVNAADPSVNNAQKLFEKYMKLETSFDPQVADLFALSAIIQTTRKFPNGEERSAKITADQYRALMRVAMPLAKAQGDKNTYSQISYTPEGDRVLVKCQRQSQLKKSISSVEMIVGPDDKGEWKIFGETTQTQQ